MTYATQPAAPLENVARGTIFSLLIIPAGVVAWLIVWNFGFVASFIAFLVSFGAMGLYRAGAGWIGRAGALVITVVTIVTLLLAFFSGIVSDGMKVWTATTDQTAWAAIVTPEFWDAFWSTIAEPGVLADYLPNFGIALLFGALGCFRVIRGAFRESASAPAQQYAQQYAQQPFDPSSRFASTPPPVDPNAPTYGAPAAPQYGAPAAPQNAAPFDPSVPPQFGVRAEPTYGAPAAPAYGAPAVPPVAPADPNAQP